MVLSRRLEYISVEIIKKICFSFFRKTTYPFRCTSSIFPLNMNYTIKPVIQLLQQLPTINNNNNNNNNSNNNDNYTLKI